MIDYHVSSIMIQKKRIKIAFFIDWIGNFYQFNLLKGITDAVGKSDSNLITFIGGALNAPGLFESMRNTIYNLVDKHHFDGLIIAAGTLSHYLCQSEIDKFISRFSFLPVVSISQVIRNVHSILIDNKIGLKKIMNHLIKDHNRRNIAFLGGGEHNQDSRDRFEAYKTTLKENGIPFNPDLVVHNKFTTPGGRKSITHILDSKIPFDAVVAANDDIAFGVLEVLKQKKIPVPGEIVVTGFDDAHMSKFVNPSLTTVKQPVYKQGMLAVEVLLSIIQGNSIPLKTYLPTEPVYRESCGCFKSTNETSIITFFDRKINSRENHGNHIHPEDLIKIEAAIRVNLKNYNHIMQAFNHKNLIRAFFRAISEKKANLFIDVLESLLHQTFEEDGDISFFSEWISLLALHVLPYSRSQEDAFFTEILWHRSRLMISGIRKNQEDYLKLVEEMNIYIFREIAGAFPSLEDTDSLIKLLYKNFPQIGIKRYFITLCEESEGGDLYESNSHLFIAYDNENKIEELNNKEPFPTRDILPPSILKAIDHYSLFVEPIFLGNQHLGLAVFEESNGKSLFYSKIRRLLVSTAFNSKFFLQKVQNQADRLRNTNKKLTQTLDDLRSAQERLVMAEKMAALGGLVAGVAHELNTPLGNSLIASSFLKRESENLLSTSEDMISTNKNLKEYLQNMSESTGIIMSNLKRASKLINNFKQIAVDQTIEEKRLFNIKEYIEEILLTLKPQFKKCMVSVNLECPDSITLCNYPGAFFHVFTNLINNSLIHAFNQKESGIIRIRVEKKDGTLLIQYSDNGRGMDKTVQKKIFDPFFTTNRGGGGVGLGLHLVFNIISRSLNGTITCSSEQEKGTIFTITIPI